MAVLQSQEHPDAIRRTPSSGDGGVDILVPEDNEQSWHVRQVKGFADPPRMTSGRRRQVESSLDAVLADPRLNRPICRWSLTAPIDPTSGEQDWFEQITAQAPFPCSWEGKVYWDRMASRYPHVIDYYLRDGRSRVEQRANALLSAVQAPSASDPLQAIDVAGHLDVLRAYLNKDDPHYRYEFLTGARPTQDSLPPGTVLSASRWMDDGQNLTIMVIPRHRYSIKDSPIGGSLQLRIQDPDRGIDLRQEFDEHRTFGIGFDIPQGAMDVSLSAPGGLGGSFMGAGGRIGPATPRSSPEVLRLRLVDVSDRSVVDEVRLNRTSSTRGDLGGIEWKGVDSGDVISFELRLLPDEEAQTVDVTFTIGVRELSGLPVRQVIDGVRFLARLTSDHELQMMEEYGSRVLGAQQLPESAAPIAEVLLRFYENLNRFQNNAQEAIRIPENIDDDTLRHVAELAHLFRTGEIRGTWTEATFGLKGELTRADLTSDEQSLGVEGRLNLKLDDQSYDLGAVHWIAPSARLAPTQPDDQTTVRYIPGTRNEVVQRLGGLPDGSNETGSVTGRD